MPQYSNVHAYLDNNELHPPRDFSLALPDAALGKNLLGELEWTETYWQRPVKALWDASQIPSSPAAGDRYLVVDMGNTTLCGTAIGSTAECLHADWPPDVSYNSIVEYYTLNNDGNPINEWQAIQPKNGYRVQVLDEEAVYYFDGDNWKPDTAQIMAPGAFQQVISRADLLDLRDAGQLQPGKRYYISDVDVILTANSTQALSAQGDHTRVLPAHGYYDLDGWTTGSVSSVIYNGAELLGVGISHTGDLLTSVAAVADALQANGHTAMACETRLILFATSGNDANGTQFQITVDGSPDTSSAFARGYDKGELWFQVEYDIDANRIYSMKDHLGNEVYADAATVSTLGTDPIEQFPWGYNQVRANRVHNSLLTAYTATGTIIDNMVFGGSILMAGGFQGVACEMNEVTQGAQFQLQLAAGTIVNNQFSAGAQVDVRQQAGLFSTNRFHASNVLAMGLQVAICAYNDIALSICTMTGISNPAMQIIQNQITSCGTFNAADLSASFRSNKIEHCSINLQSCAAEVRNNSLSATELELDNATATGSFHNNTIQESTLVLTTLNNEFRNNRIYEATVSATGCQGVWSNNDISGGAAIDLDDYTGSGISNNIIHGGTLTGGNVSGELFSNHFIYSQISLANYSGPSITDNHARQSTMTLDGASGGVGGNKLDNSTMEVVYSSGDFIFNQLKNDSLIQGNSYTGDSCSFSELIENSKILINDSTGTIGRVFLRDVTTLNLNSSANGVYILEGKVTGGVIELDSPKLNIKMTRYFSNLDCEVIPVGNVVDFDTSGNRFAGILVVNLTGTIDSFDNLDFAPDTFIIKASISTTVLFSSVTSSNIVLPNGVTNINLNGNSGDYVIFRKNGTLTYVESINQF